MDEQEIKYGIYKIDGYFLPGGSIGNEEAFYRAKRELEANILHSLDVIRSISFEQFAKQKGLANAARSDL